MDEQQATCAKCEALREEARDELERRMIEIHESFYKRMEEIFQEHQRGDHGELAQVESAMGREVKGEARWNMN